MKRFKYTCSGNVAWTSWDHGEVEAQNSDEARVKAKQEMLSTLDLVNETLAANESTKGLSIDMSFNDLEVEEIPAAVTG